MISRLRPGRSHTLSETIDISYCSSKRAGRELPPAPEEAAYTPERCSSRSDTVVYVAACGVRQKPGMLKNRALQITEAAKSCPKAHRRSRRRSDRCGVAMGPRRGYLRLLASHRYSRAARPIAESIYNLVTAGSGARRLQPTHRERVLARQRPGLCSCVGRGSPTTYRSNRIRKLRRQLSCGYALSLVCSCSEIAGLGRKAEPFGHLCDSFTGRAA